MRKLLGILPVLACLAAIGTARADVLYMQPTDFPVLRGVGVWASQNDTNPGGVGNYATAYDNFTLLSTGSITDVHWQGGYFNPPSQLAPITAFTIRFWADVGGQPGAVPLATFVIPGNANETFAGPEPASSNPGGNLVFDYSTNLPGSFLALEGTTYWLSIVPDLAAIGAPGQEGQWGWHTGTGGDGISVQDYFGQRFVNGDLTFSLTGTFVVPEPASIVLCGIGGLTLIGYRRWRRKPL